MKFIQIQINSTSSIALIYNTGPEKGFLFKVNKRNTIAICVICLQLQRHRNDANDFVLVFFCELWIYFQACSKIYIDDFEHVIACWDSRLYWIKKLDFFSTFDKTFCFYEWFDIIFPLVEDCVYCYVMTSVYFVYFRSSQGSFCRLYKPRRLFSEIFWWPYLGFYCLSK